jgi:hypothetical protein
MIPKTITKEGVVYNFFVEGREDDYFYGGYREAYSDTTLVLLSNEKLIKLLSAISNWADDYLLNMDMKERWKDGEI